MIGHRGTRMMIKAMRKQRAAFAGLGSRGAALVEFAITAPLLLLIMVGTATFSLALNNYVTLTNAVGVGAQLFSICRGATTTPYTSTVNAVKAAAPNLTPADLTINLSVNGTACTNDSACQTALSSNATNPATVSATYPCNLVVMGHNYWTGSGSCTLSAQVTERIQ